MSEQQPEGTTVNADTANVTVEAPAADTGSDSQGGDSDGGSGGLVAEDSKVEQASAESADKG